MTLRRVGASFLNLLATKINLRDFRPYFHDHKVVYQNVESVTLKNTEIV